MPFRFLSLNSETRSSPNASPSPVPVDDSKFKFLSLLPETWSATNSPMTTPEKLKARGSYPYDPKWDVNKTLLKVPIRKEDNRLFTAVNIRIREIMGQKPYDHSHNYEHIQRVVKNANDILQAEFQKDSANKTKYDPLVVFLSCVMHDIGDAKYIQPGQDGSNLIAHMLLECGATMELAYKVQAIGHTVSFSDERKDPESVARILAKHPELAIVQDADRLDALGAVGQARCDAFGGGNEVRRYQSLDRVVGMHDERFQFYVDLMKTDFGRKEALERWSFMKLFRQVYEKETDVSSVLSFKKSVV